MAAPTPRLSVTDKIAALDAISRTRSLTPVETARLEQLLFRETYAAQRARRRTARIAA